MKKDDQACCSKGGGNPVRQFALVSVFLASVGLLSMVASPVSSQTAQSAGQDQTSAKKSDAKKKSGNRRRGRRGRGGPATVAVDPVIKGRQSETVIVYGRIISDQAGVVAARTRGAIGKVLVKVGDRVTKGQALATLVTSMLDAERSLRAAELKENKASIRRADAQLALAQQELKRLEKLRKSAAFSVARYDDKLRDVERFKSARAEAEAKAEQAQAELRMAEINLVNSRVLAPFNGVVTVLHVEVGNYVNVGANIATLVNDRALEVEAEVPSNRVGGLDQGRIVEVLPEFGMAFQATVRAVVPEENALSRTRLVRFSPSLSAKNRFVAANQSVRLRIPAGPARVAVTVHKDAITVRRGNKVVFVVNESEMTASLRQVELGETFGSRFEVLNGLKPGDKVVIRGNERLRPNQKVRFQGQGRGRGGKRGGSRGKRGGDRSELNGNAKDKNTSPSLGSKEGSRS
jgi:RND family efflux transporter MFP subunit